MPLRIFYLFLGTFIFCNINIEKVIAQSFPWTKSTLLFEDKGKNNWQEKWMLDGTRSKIINSEKGLELIAGPAHGNDTCHTVLWTKQSFNGNICIE